MLTIEVKGISFENQGALLMLTAIKQEFAQRGLKARFAVVPNASFDARVKFGLWTVPEYRRRSINLLAPLKLLPKRIRAIFGIVNPAEIDAVLDASGFSYGDQWGMTMARGRLGRDLRHAYKNKPVILLPQAFGPFEKDDLNNEMSFILSHVKAAYARDDESKLHLKRLMKRDDQNLIRQCPDFTMTLKGVNCTSFDDAEMKYCVIPNSKMLTKTSLGNQYEHFLIELLNMLTRQGRKPFLLIHEGQSDRQLAERIKSQLEQNIPILDPKDPLQIKGVIGQSKFVISSRFHGLVSALSQGVPVLATGWSHKYQQLLSDFDCEDLLIDLTGDNSLEKAGKLLDKFDISTDNYQTLQRNLIFKKQNFAKEISSMWDSVFELLNDNKEEQRD